MRMELVSFQLCPAMRANGHRLKHRRFRLNMRGHFFTGKVTALGQAAQRGCGVACSGDIQNPPGWHPAQCVVYIILWFNKQLYIPQHPPVTSPIRACYLPTSSRRQGGQKHTLLEHRVACLCTHPWEWPRLWLCVCLCCSL